MAEKFKLPEGVKDVTSEYGGTDSLTVEERAVAIEQFLRGTKKSSIRQKVLRLSLVLADGDDTSDEFYSALWFYSLPANENLLQSHFAKYAKGVMTADLTDFDSNPDVESFEKRKKPRRQRKSRGKRN